MAASPVTFPAGTRFGEGGRYEVRRRVGVGGMAEVYKAVDTRLARRVVAIKTLSAAMADHPFAAKLRQLFIQEAQALSRINDENVVGVFDFGVENGTPYMVMEFLQGVDLGAFLRAVKRLPVEEAVDLMLAICSGVHACHMAGIIHRDLKPANIFLSQTAQGRQPKVLDFGVAKMPAPGAADADNVRTELVVGTPNYMPPEQARGRSANELSDQYAIGALLFRCIYGRVPDGSSPIVPELIGGPFRGLPQVMLRALDPMPDKRFGTVHELGQALLPFASEAARVRWQAYYHSAPRRFDPITTGSTMPPPKLADSPFEAPTVAVGPSPAPDESAAPTIVDEPSARRPPASADPTTVDIPRRPSSSASAEVVSDVEAPSVGVSLSGRDHSRRDRFKIIGSAVATAAVIVAVSSIAGLRLSHRPRPSSVTTTAVDSLRARSELKVIDLHPVTGTERLSGAPSPAPAASAEAPVTAPEIAPSVVSPSLSEPTHHARRHRLSTTPAVQYGAEGMPILH